MDWKRIKHFRKNEFLCSHCGVEEMDEGFIQMLDATREQVGVPMRINSGYRCQEYDSSIGGEGNHPTGKAADIAAATSRARYLILAAALDVGFTRIGIGKNFIHLDNCGADEDKPREVVWLY